MLHCEFSYIQCFNEQNVLIKAQQNTSQNTLHVRYQLLHISATWCHPQGVKNNKRFISPKRVVLVVEVVIVVVVVVVVKIIIVLLIVVVVIVVVTITVVFVIAVAVVTVAVTVEFSPA